MSKVDKTVLQETKFLGVWSLIFSMLMQAVFLVLRKWDYTVLLGNLWGVFVTLLNFFLLGLTVQIAVTKEEKEARNVMKLSHTLRNLMVLVLAIVGVVLPWFSTLPMIIALFFPRVAMTIRGFQKGGA